MPIEQVRSDSRFHDVVTVNGRDGKSAYDLAVENGLTNASTLEEFIQSLKGDPGIYIGADEPTDQSINVWIDTSGDGINTTLEITNASSNNDIPTAKAVYDFVIAQLSHAR